MNDTEEKKRKGDDFLLQGAILAAAGIIVRFIGLIYKIPMTRILGDEGIGYYNTAYEIYNIGLILSSYSLPLAISKLLAGYEYKGERENSRRVLVCGGVLGAVAGGVVTAGLLAGAEKIAEVIFKSPGSALPLRVMAPTILVFSLMGVLRGYFQGHGNMVPTSVSQIVEQLVHAAVSIWASFDFMRRFAGKENPASYGAAGGTLGTFAGAAAAFVLLAVLTAKHVTKQKRMHSAKAAGEKSEETASLKHIFMLLFLTVLPIILSQTVYQLSGTVDNALFGNLMSAKGLDEAQRQSMLGIYSGKYRLLTNVPVAIATSLGASMIPSIVMSRLGKDTEEVRHKIGITIKFNMLLAIPCAVGMGVLASPVMQLLFGDSRKISSDLLRLGSCAVVFFSLSTVTNAVLQGIDLMRKSVTHSAVSLLIHVIFVYVMLKWLDWGVYGLVIGNVTFALVVCILNWRAIGRELGYRQEVRRTFLLPLCAATAMGASTAAVYSLTRLWAGNTVGVIAAVCAGIIVYGAGILKLKAVTREELEEMPLGRSLSLVFFRKASAG